MPNQRQLFEDIYGDHPLIASRSDPASYQVCHIILDLDPDDPRDPRNGNLGIIAISDIMHAKEGYGDVSLSSVNAHYYHENLERFIVQKPKNATFTLGLNHYDQDILILAPHYSDLNSTNKSDFGIVYTTAEKEKDYIKHWGSIKDFNDDKKSEILTKEIMRYNSYLCGDVFRAVHVDVETCNLGHKHQYIIDSSNTFYASDSDIQQQIWETVEASDWNEVV